VINVTFLGLAVDILSTMMEDFLQNIVKVENYRGCTIVTIG
jgi:hypothetical protein